MRTRAGNWFKRISNLSLASLYIAGLVVAGLTPILLNSRVAAAPGVTYSTMGFSDLSWSQDRTLPTGGSSTVGNSLTMNVDGSKQPSDHFYRYEGLQTKLPANTTSASAKLFVDPSWSGHKVIVGMWGVMPGSSPSDLAWPILEFNTVDNSSATVDIWDTFDNGNLKGFTTVSYGSTIQLEISVNTVTNTLTYFLNNSPIYTENAEGYGPISNLIFDNYNNGDSYTTKWSNLQLGTRDTLAPTGLSISRNNKDVTNGAVNKINAGDNIVLNFNAVTNANQYITRVTYPGGSTDVWNSYHNTWLVNNGAISQGVFSKYGNGVYTYQVQARDATTNRWSGWSSPVSLTFDNLPPTITSITANGNPLALNGSSKVSALNGITFNVKASDPSGYGYTYVELNTAAPSFVWKAATTGAFDTTLVTPANQYTDGKVYGLKICPTDKLGNGACTQVNFTVDNTRPTITFTSPTSFNAGGNYANQSIVIGGGQTLGISASDPSGISNTVLHVYNSDNSAALFCPVSNTSTTTCNLSSLGQGNYYVKAGANDTAGNNQTVTKYFTVDTAKPTVKVNLSRQSYLTNGGTASSLQVPEIEAFDTHLSEIQILKNGLEVTHWYNVTPGVTTYKKINWLGEGTYTIRAYDTAGNVSDDFTITIDNTAPNVPTNGSPAGNTYLTSNVFNYTWSNEASSGAVRYEYQFSDSPSTDVNGTLTNVTWSSMANASSTQLAALSAGPSIPSEGTGDGHHYWQVRSVDAYGNKSAWSTVWDFTLDSVGPSTPKISSPNNGDYFKSSPILDAWTTSTDNLTGVAGYQIAYNYDDGHSFGGTNDCPTAPVFSGYSGFIGCRWVNGTQRNHVPALNEQGGVTIWVRARDNAGNWSSWSNPVHYFYDATAPKLTYVTYNPTADGVVPVITSDGTSSDYTYTWTTDPSNPDNSPSVISDPSLLMPTFSPTLPGNYVYHLVATDKAGNASGLDFLFTIPAPQTGGQGGGTTPQVLTTNATPTTPTTSNVTNVSSQPAVLGATTNTPNTPANTDTNSGDSGVLGTQTTNSNTKKGGLAWYWWLLIALAAIGLGWFFAWLRSRRNDENQN